MSRGEIHLCDFGDPQAHEPGYRRPAVVVSASRLAGLAEPIVVPVTRTRRGYVTHVEIEAPLREVCYVQCEQIRVVAERRLIRLLGRVDPVDLGRIDTVLRRILDL